MILDISFSELDVVVEDKSKIYRGKRVNKVL